MGQIDHNFFRLSNKNGLNLTPYWPRPNTALSYIESAITNTTMLDITDYTNILRMIGYIYHEQLDEYLWRYKEQD